MPHVSCMYPACLLHIRYVSLWMHLRYMYPMIVSQMYPVCILITSADTCIPNVSCMYLASQIRICRGWSAVYHSNRCSLLLNAFKCI
jgi:hypothetical protein